MAKKNDGAYTFNIGSNISAILTEDNKLILELDLNRSGVQTKGSKEPGKQPNEMVASTSTYAPVPGTDGRLMLHFIRPMAVQQVRKSRALKELESEDNAAASKVAADPELQATLAKLKAAGLI